MNEHENITLSRADPRLQLKASPQPPILFTRRHHVPLLYSLAGYQRITTGPALQSIAFYGEGGRHVPGAGV